MSAAPVALLMALRKGVRLPAMALYRAMRRARLLRPSFLKSAGAIMAVRSLLPRPQGLVGAPDCGLAPAPPCRKPVKSTGCIWNHFTAVLTLLMKFSKLPGPALRFF